MMRCRWGRCRWMALQLPLPLPVLGGNLLLERSSSSSSKSSNPVRTMRHENSFIVKCTCICGFVNLSIPAGDPRCFHGAVGFFQSNNAMFFSRSFLDNQASSSASTDQKSQKSAAEQTVSEAATAPETRAAPTSSVGLLGSACVAQQQQLQLAPLSHLSEEQQQLLREIEHRHDPDRQKEGDDKHAESGCCGKCPEKPRIAKPHLIRVHLEPGKTYRWCSCGFAKDENQPFCDDTCHTDPNIRGWEPVEFSVQKENKYHALCGCKYSKSGWRCDGSHNYLNW